MKISLPQGKDPLSDPVRRAVIGAGRRQDLRDGDDGLSE
jgi:hypothetical protein